ncbi:F0F1 ATP synthase subunit gamma [Halarcobacter ebronensis]|uniref:ATP synthase gamma chain n=1 Tax=Halarcobacter ebronensis TaxID=1462615 RepID=A0A4Q1AYF1_9BACT|nr:ATP synthase F1 subunit gamma [Halarcobacter ebronensis]QKF82705.1 ATP synthase, F1 complex, gamma subunit [Halarcobacter ebronensis]RXJ69776.1 F0F1 ATP synthase subunit gamma [Halarcobacter ebronensis]RXK06731.1 F0F1 ATP synthase subunit gamma [Halarcobacter ebronensis]
MANLKEIKLKIGSVKNTQKTTKAMKLVSSAKLTRTRQLSDQSRSYAKKINEVLSEIANRVSKVQDGGNQNKAFIPVENPKTVDLVFVTADKGLCGGFNMATIKTVSKLAAEYEAKGTKVRYRVAGRKGVDFFSFQKVKLEQAVTDLSSAPDYDRAANFIGEVVKDFQNGETDKVILVYNGFLNMLAQEIRVRDLLPISLENVEVSENETSMLEIEPDDDEEVLNELTGKYIDFNMYYSLIDSLAAEHSARMQAMDAATNNAKDRVNSLTVEYNKARQAAITTELIEIISGVESLK